MALTREQLQANIEAMEAQGAPQEDIQGYLDSFKGQTPQEQTTPPVESPKKSLGTKILGEGIVGNTAQAIPGIIGKRREDFQRAKGQFQAGDITRAEAGLQLVGAGAGAFTDIIGKGIGETVKAIGETPMSKGTDTLGERFGRGLTRIGATPISGGTDTLGERLGRGVTNIIGSQPVQAGVQAIESRPRLKANLQAVGNIASVIPVGEALGLATKGAKTTVRALKPTAEVLAGAQKVGSQVKKGGKLVGNKVLGSSANKATNLLKATENVMSQRELKQAIDEGRQAISRFGKVDILPSETEKRAGSILAGKLSKNPVRNVPVIKKEISTRGKEVENYLMSNTQKISNKEFDNAFSKAIAEDSKYLTPSQKKAYQEQINIFQKELHGRGGYDTNNSYKALKDYEANVTENLPKGKEALLADYTAGARLQAAKRVRSTVRDILAQKHPEFKDKMFDLASLYDVKDTMISKASKVAKTSIGRFIQRNPTTSKVIGTAAAGGGLTLIGGKLFGK